MSDLVPAASGGVLMPRLRRILGLPDADAARSSRWLAGAVAFAIIALAALGTGIRHSAKAAAEQRQPAATQPAKADLSNDVIAVRGRVVDPDGKPFAGADIAISPNVVDEPAAAPSHPVARAKSGADGRYEISFRKSQMSPFTLKWGQPGAAVWNTAQVIARAEGFGLAWSRWDHVDGSGDVVLKLVPDQAIEGRILDQEGKPVEGVKVAPTSLMGPGWTGLPSERTNVSMEVAMSVLYAPLAAVGLSEMASTDAQGQFHFAGLGADRTVTLEFASDKVAIPMQHVITTLMEPVTRTLGNPQKPSVVTFYGARFDLPAPPARSVVGTIRDAKTHKPRRRVRLEIVNKPFVFTETAFHLSTVTDAQGQYHLDGLGKGQDLHLQVTPDEDQAYLPILTMIRDTPGLSPITRDFDLHEGIWITGRVTDSTTGEPIPAIVQYAPMRNNPHASELPEYQELLMERWARGPQGLCYTRPDGSYRTVGLPGEAIVAAFTYDRRYRLAVGADQFPHSAGYGTFELWLGPKLVSRAKRIDIKEDATGATVDLPLEREDSAGAEQGDVRVTAVDPQGKPVNDPLVQSTPVDGLPHVYLPTATFGVSGPQRNEDRVVVVMNRRRKLGKVFHLRLADAPHGRMPVTLEPLATITGRLLAADGKPVNTGRVDVEARFKDIRNGKSVADLFTQPDGRFALEFPTGANLFLYGSRGAATDPRIALAEDLSLQPGQTQDLGDLRLEPKRRN